MNEYCDAETSRPISIPSDIKRELNAKARKLIRLANQGKLIPFTDIIFMKQELLKELVR